MDFEKHQNLRTIIMLKEVIRKWWQLELGFADKDGGESATPRRCAPSIRVLHEKFRGSRKSREPRVHACDCHPEVGLVGAPVYLDDDYQGFLMVEGLSTAIAPGEAERLADLLELAVDEVAHHERASQPLPSAPAESSRFEHMVGSSGPMREVFRLLEKVSHSESTVLINGESGTGKELVARALHEHGARRDKPFVVQNCSAFNDNLLESALFGHTRGSFTGAFRDKKGLFEVADGGTFFLDEVGDMSPALQVKLLRVLQEGTFLPVGGNQTRQVDVRVIAATHKDLSDLVKRGEFREDLYYRINVIRVQVPALRERRDDIPVLVDHFLRKHHREGQRTRGLTLEAMQLLLDHAWPGNIRELENEIERLLVLGADLEVIPGELVSSRIRQAVTAPGPSVVPAWARASGRLNDAVELLEREMISSGLERTGFNKSRLSRELGISRSNLILKIARYGLDKPGMDGNDEDEALSA